MDDQDWEVQGIDPELRLRAAQEADARGVTLAEYLTTILHPETSYAPGWRGRLEAGLGVLRNAASDGDAAQAIHKALRDIRISVAGLERAQDAATAKLDQQIQTVAATVDALESGQRALKEALASDFVEFAEHTLAQVDARLASSAPHHTDDYEHRLGALAQRSAVQEEAVARSTATLMDRISEVERDLKKRLQALTTAQNKGDAALTSEIAQLAYGVRGELDGIREAIKAAEGARRDDRGRIDELDAALDRIAGELSLFRDFAEQGLARSTDHQAQIQRHLTRINADWDARFDALASRLGRTEQTVDRVEAVGSAEIERIEACTVAALQKLGGDIAAVRSTGAAQDGEARARLDVIAEEHALLERRLAMLEAAATRAETEQALAIIQEKIAELSESRGVDAGQDERPVVSEKDSTSLAAQVRGLEEQLTRMEQRHANALDMVRGQLAQFAAENEQRLAFLESTPSSGPDVDMLAFRLARLEQRDVEADLEALRSRLDQRVLDLEARSITALERLGDSIADLERRVLDGDEGAAARSA